MPTRIASVATSRRDRAKKAWEELEFLCLFSVAGCLVNIIGLDQVPGLSGVLMQLQ